MPDASAAQPLPIRHVAVVGTGLIGGSWALGVKRFAPHVTVTASDRPDVLDVLAARGGCDRTEPDARVAVEQADLIVLATPLALLPDVLARVAPHVPAGALVTDAGSVKAAVGALGASLLPGRFVGGHPMAGSEHAGVAHASALLFQNAAYALCPSLASERHPLLPALVALIETLGARVLTLDARAHDRAAALVSHVPQLVAVVLAAEVGAASQDEPMTRLLAGGGFRDLTRIASSPYATWEGILVANRNAVAAALDGFVRHIGTIRQAVAADDREALRALFSDANAARAAVPDRRKGLVRAYPEVLLHAVDRPGFLAAVFSTLADAGLNVKDAELLLVREGTGGAFRLALASDADVIRALSVLAQAGFSAERR